MMLIGWGVRRFTRILVRNECAELARSLQNVVTSRRLKIQAATILLNIASETPVCQFCGGGSSEVKWMVESPFNPKVMICDFCAVRAASHLEHARADTDIAGNADGATHQ